MFEGIKNIFTKTKDGVEKTEKVIKVTPKVTMKVIKEEIEEIKDLHVTEADNIQAEMITDVAITAMTALGIPSSIAVKEIIKTSIAYGLRDIKEGSTNPQKLIAMRVVNAYKEKMRMI